MPDVACKEPVFSSSGATLGNHRDGRANANQSMPYMALLDVEQILSDNGALSTPIYLRYVNANAAASTE